MTSNTELAHRTCWRYKKSSDPQHSDTYTFNDATLELFAEAIRTGASIDKFNRQMNQACEEARLLDRSGEVADMVQEPFGYFRAMPFGWEDCGENDEGAVALYDRSQVVSQQEPVEWYDKIEGMEVSMDVSTGEHDDTHRVFGRVSGVMLQSCGAQDDIILAIEDSRNFATPPTAALPVPEVQCCNWTQGYDDAEQGAWKTDCDSYWYIIDGSPSDNKMKFCHGCGKPIAEHPYVETGEEK